MTVPPNSGLTLTTHGTSDQAAYHYVSYANPTTLSIPVANTNFGAAVIGVAYGTYTVPDWTLVNLSTITGYNSGVHLYNGGLVDNQAATSSIIGQQGGPFGSYGVQITGNAGTVANQGTITAASGGIYLAAGGAVINGASSNAYAGILGLTRGIYVEGGAGVITNYGSIEGQTALYLRAGGTVTNIQNVQQHFNDSFAANAAIRGDTVAGIIVANASATINNSGGVISGLIGILGTTNAAVTVQNSGRIYGANRANNENGPAISLQNGGLIVNQFVATTVSTGTVGDYATVTLAGRLTGGTGIEAVNKPAFVVNYSYIAADNAYGAGIGMSSGGTIFNGGVYAGGHPGTITGYAAIVMQGGESSVYNHVGSLIEGRATASNGFAVRLPGLLLNSGTITGGAGVSDDFAIVGTTTISPAVGNSGTILATYAAVSMIGAGASSAASFVNYSGGLVQGGDFGVALTNADADISNLGTIKALKGFFGFRYPVSGIYFANGSATIDNGADSITSAYVFGKYQGVYVYGGDSTITNYGTIKGKTGISTFRGTHANTVNNFGTIIGTLSNAIFFGVGNSRLIDHPGAVFVGNVFGNVGTNVLELDTGTGAGTLIGLGSSFDNFSTILVDPDANWYVDGSDFVALTSSGGTITNVGTLSVRQGGLFSNFGSVGGGITIANNATLRNSGRISNGDDAVVGSGTHAVLQNTGMIIDNGATGAGVLLMQDATVVNATAPAPTAAITGVNYGIRAQTAATLTNYGTVGATIAVGFNAGGLISNGLTSDTVALIAGTLAGIASHGGTVINDATITGGADGIIMFAADTIVNGSTVLTTPLIGGDIQGIYVKGAPGNFDATTIANFATVSGASIGIYVVDGYGNIINGASNSTAALIAGQNYGIAIVGNGSAGALPSIAITNFGTIAGTIGAVLYDAAVLTNSGTIVGGGGIAAAFGAGDDALVEFPGAVLDGTADGGAGHNYLELGAGTFGSLGDLFGFGTSIVNFATVAVDTNAAWQFVGHSTFAPSVTLTNDGAMYAGTFDDLRIDTTLHADPGGHGVVIMKNAGTADLLGSVAADQAIYFGAGGNVLDIGNTGQFAGTIHGFDHTGLIDLLNLSANAAQWSANVLTVKSGGIPVAYLDLVGSFTGAHFFVGPDSGSGTNITTDLGAPCFAAGTRIGTERGDVRVEDLRVRDRVVLACGAGEDIMAIHKRSIDCRRHPRTQRVWPVRIAAHAFGRDRPHRDLLLSPDHAVYVDGVLIPAKHLINGTTIVQQPRDTIDYFHIELRCHAVLLAEGLEVESYLATDSARADVAWEAAGCAPLVVTGPILAAVRRRLGRLAARRASGKLAA